MCLILVVISPKCNHQEGCCNSSVVTLDLFISTVTLSSPNDISNEYDKHQTSQGTTNSYWDNVIVRRFCCWYHSCCWVILIAVISICNKKQGTESLNLSHGDKFILSTVSVVNLYSTVVPTFDCAPQNPKGQGFGRPCAMCVWHIINKTTSWA